MNAITVYDEPCWTLVHADGRPAGFEDQEPHFDTKDQALKAAPGYGDEDRPAPTAKRLDELCAVATAACGYRYDEDEGVEHWPSAGELRSRLAREGWRTGSDGEMRHPRGDCEDCDAMPDTPDLTPLPGQIDLLSGVIAPQAPSVEYRCPGSVPRSHGLSETVAHSAGCCAGFATLSSDQKAASGLRYPGTAPDADVQP